MNVGGMNPDGTGATQITDPSTPKTQPTWSSDGTRIAFVRSGEIYTINADSTDETNLTKSTFIDSRPAWSPDGSRIAFVSRHTGDTNSNIYVMDTDPMTNDATNLMQNSTTADN
jgi:Tol biopolymer transport system component